MSDITIIANGQSFQVAHNCPLPEFLEKQGLPRDRVVVEYNGHAVTPQAIEKILLQEGDHLEIVRIVAGG